MGVTLCVCVCLCVYIMCGRWSVAMPNSRELVGALPECGKWDWELNNLSLFYENIWCRLTNGIRCFMNKHKTLPLMQVRNADWLTSHTRYCNDAFWKVILRSWDIWIDPSWHFCVCVDHRPKPSEQRGLLGVFVWHWVWCECTCHRDREWDKLARVKQTSPRQRMSSFVMIYWLVLCGRKLLTLYKNSSAVMLYKIINSFA